MTTSFGDRVLPVKKAGQASWHRPHSVQVMPSTICFQVMSWIVPIPNRIWSSGTAGSSKTSGSRRPLARVRAKKTLNHTTRMWRCFVYGMYTRNDRISRTWVHTIARSNVAVDGEFDRNPPTKLEIGAHAAGYSLSPSEIREPCHRN